MTGDRKLTEEEIQLFLQNTLFLDKVNDSGGEPSLYDTFFIEISAKLDGYFNIIVQQGKKIKLLEEQLQELKEELKNR